MKEKRSHFLYKKLFMTYTIIVVSIVLTLELFFISSIHNQMGQNNTRYNQLLCQDAGKYIKGMESISNIILNNLYKSEEELIDTIWFLEYKIEDYLKLRLKSYSESKSIVYHGIEDFAQESMDLNPHIEKITFISYKRMESTVFQNNSDVRTYKIQNEILNLMNEKVVAGDGTFSIMKEIRNPKNAENVGAMLLTCDVLGLQDAFEYYARSNLLVINSMDQIIYNSESRLELSSLYDSDDTLLSYDKIGAIIGDYVTYNEVNGIKIFAYMDRSKAEQISIFLWISLVAMGVALFVLGEIALHFWLGNFTKRLEKILEAMSNVKEGNLDTNLERTKKKSKDELDLISEYFNEMCEELNMYIHKSLLAEIEQKNAEMNALQSQINPHFLYNTLESVRMKAISNGDREVAKMLYGLAVIFRSQIKENDIITIAKELHYCKKYLELFEFRYQNKFRFEIECKEEYLSQSVIKFIIQPIIENYFMHGIRLKEEDNVLKILISQQNEDMYIQVEDNGFGMTREEVIKKNSQLDQLVAEGNMIGMMNVQKRLRWVYGQEYGLYLEKNIPLGLKVIIKFPKDDKKEERKDLT